jgi:hypothetical protein
MADSRTYEKSRSTPLAVNSEEPSEICIGCAELEVELKKTQIELKSAKKMVELLRKEIKQMEGIDLTRCSRDVINKCNQEVYEISQCSKCVESEVKHQDALLEIRSLQSTNKVLYKELGMSDTKSEVMADTETMVMKRNEDFNSGQSIESKRENNFMNGNDELLCMTGDDRLRKKVKCYYDDVMSQNKHITNHYNSRIPRKVKEQHKSDFMHNQNDNLEPKKIPTVINGFVLETRDFSTASKNKKCFSLKTF